MEKEIAALNDIFDSELTIRDLDRKVEEMLVWDSYHIMNFLSEAEAQFHKKVSIEQISEVIYVYDLIQLIIANGGK